MRSSANLPLGRGVDVPAEPWLRSTTGTLAAPARCCYPGGLDAHGAGGALHGASRRIQVDGVQVRHLDLCDLAQLGPGDGADHGPAGRGGTLLQAGRLAQHVGRRRGLEDEREAAVLEDGDLRRITWPLWAAVFSLYDLVNSTRLMPWGPSTVPTGGAGVALPAGSWSVTTARIFLAICQSYLSVA